MGFSFNIKKIKPPTVTKVKNYNGNKSQVIIGSKTHIDKVTYNGVSENNKSDIDMTQERYRARIMDEAHEVAQKISEEKKIIIENRTNFIKEKIGTGPSEYREWFYGSEKYGADWCAIFVNWIFNHDGDSNLYISKDKDTAIAGEGIEESIKAGYGTWYEDENTDHETIPKAGDVVSFTRGMDEESDAPWGYDENGNKKTYKWETPYGSDHVGYVYKVDNEYIYTIEGNTGPDDVNADTSSVNMKKYKRTDKTINGYYRPNY